MVEQVEGFGELERVFCQYRGLVCRRCLCDRLVQFRRKDRQRPDVVAGVEYAFDVRDV